MFFQLETQEAKVISKTKMVYVVLSKIELEKKILLTILKNSQ